MKLRTVGLFVCAGLVCGGSQTVAADINGKYDALERKLNIVVEEAKRLQGCEEKEKGKRNTSFLVAGAGVAVAIVGLVLDCCDRTKNGSDAEHSGTLKNFAMVGEYGGLIVTAVSSCIGGYFFKESRAVHATRFKLMKEKLYKLDEENLVAIQDLEKNQKKLNEESLKTLACLKEHKEYVRKLKDEFELYGECRLSK